MPDDLTRDERDARLVLDSVLTPQARGIVEQRRREGFTDREIARWLGDTRQQAIESGHSPAEVDAELLKPDLSATTRRFMGTVAEGLTGGFTAEPRTGETRPGGPAGAMTGTGAGFAVGQPSEPTSPDEGPGMLAGFGTLAGLAALVGLAALTRGRALRRLDPATRARIAEMARQARITQMTRAQSVSGLGPRPLGLSPSISERVRRLRGLDE